MTRMVSARWMVERRWAMRTLVRPVIMRLEGEADAVFGVGVDGAGGLVEDEDAGAWARARAKLMSCFWPVERVAPRSRTGSAKLSGEGADEVGDVDLFGGAFERSSVIHLLPRRMLSAMVPVKRKGSCRTTPKRGGGR
jgi:hypothetical protein